jgi:hypothetical protein
MTAYIDLLAAHGRLVARITSLQSTIAELTAERDDARAKYMRDGKAYLNALKREAAALEKITELKLERDAAVKNQRTEGTIEVCLSCRESTLLWDPTKGVCGGGASRHMCPMMQALRAAKGDAT